jgi:alginate O-acetyltransferase complex protein AlgJ
MSEVNVGGIAVGSTERVRLRVGCLLILIFLIAITVPGLILFWQSEQNISVTEQRKLAPLPALPHSIDEAREYPLKFDAFVSDHFGFRETLVQWNNRMHIALGVSLSESVIIGKDGWLFLDVAGIRLVDQNRGALPFSEEDLNEYVSVLEQRERYLAALDIPLVYLIVPEKQSVYTEFLPDWVHVVGQSRYQQAMEAMYARGLKVVDVHGPLVASKKRGADTYQQTDTHWNCRGAWIAYQHLMAEIVVTGVSGIQVISNNDLIITEIPEAPAGDIVKSMLNLQDVMPEHESTNCKLLKERETTRKRLDDEGVVAPSAFNTQTWIYARADGIKVSRALVFRDSFATALLPFLVNTFDEVIYIDHKGVTLDPALITRFDPDVVIYEFVERRLGFKINNALLHPVNALK